LRGRCSNDRVYTTAYSTRLFLKGEGMMAGKDPKQLIKQGERNKEAVVKDGGGLIHPENEETIRRLVQELLQAKAVALGSPTFYPGASEVTNAEVNEYQAGYQLYRETWKLFGRRHTRDQINRFLWSCGFGNVADWARDGLTAPSSREQVVSWLWDYKAGDWAA